MRGIITFALSATRTIRVTWTARPKGTRRNPRREYRVVRRVQGENDGRKRKGSNHGACRHDASLGVPSRRRGEQLQVRACVDETQSGDQGRRTVAGQVEAMATWEILGSSAYRERIADGWCDTGHHRQWCGGEYETALLVKDVGADHEGGGAFDCMNRYTVNTNILEAKRGGRS